MAGTPDGQAWQADDLHALADLLTDLAPATLGPDLLDQLEGLERIKSAAAAAEAIVAATFADAADSEDVPVGGRRTPPRAMAVGAEVALATLASPYAGEQRVLLSRRLRDHLPAHLHQVHGVTEHLRLTRSTSPPLPGGPAGSVGYRPTSSGSPTTTPWRRSPARRGSPGSGP